MAKRPVAKKAPKRKVAKRAATKNTATKRTATKRTGTKRMADKKKKCEPQEALAFFLTRLAVNQKGLDGKGMLDEFINNRAALLVREEHNLSAKMIEILEKVEGGDDGALRDMICLNNQSS